MDSRRTRLRAGTLGTAVVLALTGTPVLAATTAAAAQDRPPSQPVLTDLNTAGEPCAAGGQRPYVDGTPRLRAVLHDPDEGGAQAQQASAEFEAWWTDAAGQEQRRSFTTARSTTPLPHTWQLPSDVPADTVVSWRVRATDGVTPSAWSSDAPGRACEFVVDAVSPAKAVITSPDYPEGTWRDGVGRYGSFTFDSPSDDVVEYRYTLTGGESGTLRPEQPGGPVTLRHLPLAPGPTTLDALAFDRAGRSSAVASHRFLVSDGRTPAAHWKLADAPGSGSAAAAAGPAATAGGGVTFGADAPSDTALASAAGLNGTADAFLTPGVPVVKPGATYAVGVWVRPERVDRDMTAVSQDSGTGADFALGLRTDGSAPVWSFEIGGARVSGGAPGSGQWTHLLGLYDAETGTARLYVNGKEAGTAQQAQKPAGDGDFQLGRVRTGTAYQGAWSGGLGDVRAYDRVVVPAEAAALARRAAQPRGSWLLESATDGASPEVSGDQPLRLSATGATIYAPALPEDCDLDPNCVPQPDPLRGKGHLALDGQGGYAATQQPVVDTSESFTVGARAKLADGAADRPMTLLSQAGADGDAFKVRYVPATSSWELTVTHAGTAGPRETVVSQYGRPDSGSGEYVAVVYDGAAARVTLYVNGQTGPGATASLGTPAKSTGGLQVGRGTVGAGQGEHLHGAVDEVHAFAGALSASEVTALGAR